MVQIQNPTLPEIGVASVGSPVAEGGFASQMSTVGTGLINAFKPTAASVRQKQDAAKGTLVTAFDSSQSKIFDAWQQNDGKDLSELKQNLRDNQLKFQTANPSFGKDIATRGQQILAENGLVGSIIETQEFQEKERIKARVRARQNLVNTFFPGMVASASTEDEISEALSASSTAIQKASDDNRALKEARDNFELTEVQQLQRESNNWKSAGSIANSVATFSNLENRLRTNDAQGATTDDQLKEIELFRAEVVDSLVEDYPEMYRSGRLTNHVNSINALVDFKVREVTGEVKLETVTNMNKFSEQSAIKGLYDIPGFAKAAKTFEVLTPVIPLLLSPERSKISNEIVSPILEMTMSTMQADKLNAVTDQVQRLINDGSIQEGERAAYVDLFSNQAADSMLHLATTASPEQLEAGVDLLNRWSPQFANQPDELDTRVYKNTLRLTSNPLFLKYSNDDDNIPSVENLTKGYGTYVKDVTNSLASRFNETLTEDFNKSELDSINKTDRSSLLSVIGSGIRSTVEDQLELGDIILPTFDDITGRVVFVPKKGLTTNVFTQQQVNDLNRAYSEQIGQIVRSAAHLMGSTDYRKVFNERVLEGGGLKSAFNISTGTLQFTKQIPRETIVEFNPVTREFETKEIEVQ